jgi:hypothetical protein
MNRVRAMLLLSALGLAAHTTRGDDTDWKPAEPKPAPSTPPPISAVPVAVPAAPTPTTPAPAPAEQSGWVPAKRYPVDYQPPASPAPAPAPLTPPAEPLFRPASTDPGESPVVPPRELTPSTLPPINPIPKAIDTPKPADAPKPADPPKTPPATKPSEPLPPPRSSAPAPAPGTVGSGIVTTLKDDCPPAPLPTHPNLVQASGELPPTRGRVFGSPSLNLSRDFFVRDLFGLDLYTPQRTAIGPDGSVLLDGPASDLFFFQAEYLLWWTNRYRIPTLATTSNDPAGFGFQGDPNTRNLLGPGEFGPSYRNGMRIRAGGYFDECNPVGVDGSFFFLGTARERAVFDSGQFPVITRPFFAPNTAVINAPPGAVFLPGEFGEVVARPGLSAGRLEIDTDSYLWGADANYRFAACRTCEGSRGWFAGYRHVNLTERLRITEFITATGAQAADPVGTQVVVQDFFQTRNRFHGGQLGYLWSRRMGRWDVDARASVALGVTHQIVDISGFQRRTRPGEATQVFNNGGLLAAGPNLGRFTDNRFSVVPEATFNVGYMIAPAVRVYAGYNFLFWSNVVRPGDQIDRTIDVTFVPNPPANVPPSGQFRPQPTFTQSDLWVQGVQLGVELRW